MLFYSKNILNEMHQTRLYHMTNILKSDYPTYSVYIRDKNITRDDLQI